MYLFLLHVFSKCASVMSCDAATATFRHTLNIYIYISFFLHSILLHLFYSPGRNFLIIPSFLFHFFCFFRSKIHWWRLMMRAYEREMLTALHLTNFFVLFHVWCSCPCSTHSNNVCVVRCTICKNNNIIFHCSIVVGRMISSSGTGTHHTRLSI